MRIHRKTNLNERRYFISLDHHADHWPTDWNFSLVLRCHYHRRTDDHQHHWRDHGENRRIFLLEERMRAESQTVWFTYGNKFISTYIGSSPFCSILDCIIERFNNGTKELNKRKERNGNDVQRRRCWSDYRLIDRFLKEETSLVQ